MTDFWRVANIIIVVAVIVLLVLLKGCKKKEAPADLKPVKLDALKDRKQKLACELKAYEEGMNQLEKDSRQMMDAYFAKQEVIVKDLVKAEIDTALNKMETTLKAGMRQNFNEAKIKLQK